MGGSGPPNAEREQRRLADGIVARVLLEKRYPVPNYPAITRASTGGTHYVKLPSMAEEKRFRNWSSALRFFEEYENSTHPRTRRRKEPPPIVEERCALGHDNEADGIGDDDDVDFGSIETLLGGMATGFDVGPLNIFEIPDVQASSPEDAEVLRANKCNNVAGYRGVVCSKKRPSATNLPFLSMVKHDGVSYTLGSHATAEEAALHAAKAREGLNTNQRFSERWNSEETERLLHAVSTQGCQTVTRAKEPRKWEAVAAYVGTRTAQQCYRRWDSVNPENSEHWKEMRRRKRLREAQQHQERKRRKQEAQMGITDEWITVTTAQVDEAPFKELEAIDGTSLRADETLDPSDDFVDALRERVTPTHFFVFAPFHRW